MTITELTELTALSKVRSEYMTQLRQWCDGYLHEAEIAAQKSVIIDDEKTMQVKALKARCVELILQDALKIVAYNLDGKIVWKI